jgi:hypothetical protein
MRKLLLLTNCLLLCTILSSCQTTGNGKENKPDTPNTNTPIHSETKPTDSNPNNSTTSQEAQSKTTELNRIEHGSKNQEKLDSIKKAKAKSKK